MRRWRFRPPWWAWASFLPLAALLASLGLWQWERGQTKEQMLDHYLAAAVATPVVLDRQAPPPDPEQVRRAEAVGVYEPARELLLDNQSHQRRPGVRVWTPLRLQDGSLVLVDRGWLPVRGDRAPQGLSPPPMGEQRVLGYWRAFPQPGLRLGRNPCAPGDWPRHVQYPLPEELACLYGEPLLPGLLLLDPAAEGGFVRAWTEGLTAIPPERHYGYALQWFALCTTLFVLFVILNLKKAT